MIGGREWFQKKMERKGRREREGERLRRSERGGGTVGSRGEPKGR